MSAIRTFGPLNVPVRITNNIDQLGLCIVSLIRNTVPAFILPFINISLLKQAVKNVLYDLLMLLICCTNEIIVRDIKLLPELLNSHNYFIDKLLGSHPFLLSLLFDLLTVFICTCQEAHIISTKSFVAGHCVPSHRSIGMANMQLVTWIVDRCGQVKSFLVRHQLSSSWNVNLSLFSATSKSHAIG
ncbi:hypothetical protein D3C81_1035180 [compost metagenome]